MTVNLSFIETAVPETCVPSHESLYIANALCGPYMSDAGWLPAVYENCGVKQRYQVLGQAIVNDLLHDTRISQSPFLPGKIGGPTTAERMAIYTKEAGPLALQAARRTLHQANFTGDHITHLVNVSCTGFQAPGIDVLLMGELGMSPGVERTHIGFMGCHGALNGLRVAKAFCEANPDAIVLLCVACTTIMEPNQARSLPMPCLPMELPRCWSASESGAWKCWRRAPSCWPIRSARWAGSLAIMDLA